MESNIKQTMLDEFNQIMEQRNSIIRLKFTNTDIVKIGLVEDDYIEEVSPIMKNDFYVDLQDFFKSRGVENLRFNNIGSSFWSFSSTK